MVIVRVFQKSEKLSEDGQVRPKYVAIDCDFNVILNWSEQFYVALKTAE
jgi:hypothetical protein